MQSANRSKNDVVTLFKRGLKMRLGLSISALLLMASGAMAQQVGTFGACILEAANGEPINVGSCEWKPPRCTSAECKHSFHWQADDFNTEFTSGTANLFESVFAMNGQDASVPAALRDSDPRDCIYNDVSQSVFCFMNSAEAHMFAADGISAHSALLKLAGMGSTSTGNGKKGGKPSVSSPGLAALQGKYRPFPNWDCSAVGRDGGATAIEGNILRTLETDCSLSGEQSVGSHGALLYQATCHGEGETWSDEFILRKDGFGALAVLSERSVSVWESCPK